MSIALASLLAKKEDSVAGVNTGAFSIAALALGNGGTSVDGSGNVSYRTPNVASEIDILHNETYSKDVQPAVADATNQCDLVIHIAQVYSDTVVTATLDYAEPAGQNVTDNGTGTGSYTFDEIGLKTASGKLLTHLIFHPIEKSANRKLEIIYTIRITAGA
jgi:hypothetical protein